jgi:hypothetical protein
MEKRELALSYNAYFQDTASQFFGYGHPTEHGTFGFGASLFGVSDIEKRSAAGGDADAADLGSFDTQDMAVSFGWANKAEMGRGALHYGAALKYVSSDLETKSAATGAVDMGLIYKFGETSEWFASLAILNLGGELKFDEESDPLPLNVKPGFAWRRAAGRMGHVAATLDADLLVNDQKAYVQPGVEWEIVPMFTLRGGYQIGRSDGAGSGFAAGTGFRFANLGIDYAFVPYGDLGDTHRMSVGYRF